MTNNEQSEKLHRIVVSRAYDTTSKLPDSFPYEMIRNLARIEAVKILKSVSDQIPESILESAESDSDIESDMRTRDIVSDDGSVSDEEVEKTYGLRYAKIVQTKYDTNVILAESWERLSCFGHQVLIFDIQRELLRCESRLVVPSHCGLVSMKNISHALLRFRLNLDEGEFLSELIDGCLRPVELFRHKQKYGPKYEISFLHALKSHGLKSHCIDPFVLRATSQYFFNRRSASKYHKISVPSFSFITVSFMFNLF